MTRKKQIEIFLYVAFILALLAPRLLDLDAFATLDEPYWLSMGANFYYALGQREFQNTVYEYQPGVTTMWIVTAAMLVYFPSYRGLGQGYLEFEKGVLDPFLLEHGKDPLVLLYYARLIQVLVIVTLLLLLFFLLKRIIPSQIALFSILFAAFDPFFLGQSRLLDHEALLSLFVIISAVSFFIYLSHQRKNHFLILSGVMAGLAQLTKSSALAILVPIGVLLLFQIYREREGGFINATWIYVRIFLVWLFVLMVAYFVFWPGMWVAPGKMLHEVYGNAFSYAFQGARLKVTGDAESAQLGLNINLSGITDLLHVFLWRTTPFTWIGALLGFVFSFLFIPQPVQSQRQLSTLYLVVFAAFVLMFGVAQGRDSPHYILTSYLALNLLAGFGWFQCIKWLATNRFFLRRDMAAVVALSVLIFSQALSAFSFFPYYYTYRNPILYSLGQHRNFPQFAYGEGLELAANYLAELPNSKNSTVLAYYARGCFSYFYPGETTRFKPYFVEPDQKTELLNSIHSADYLVVYYANQGSLDKYAQFLEAISKVKPIHEIWLNGYKYIVIYKVADFPEGVFQALAK